MTASPSGLAPAVGFRNCRIYALNSAGVPAAATYVTGSPNPYVGVRITATKALTITHPEARRVTHFGDDIVFLIDRLPPTETISGELRTGKQDLVVDALVSNTTKFAVGAAPSAEGLLIATDQQGYEPLVGLVAYQQGAEGDSTLAGGVYGARQWRSLIFPKTWLVLREQGLSEAVLEPQYAVFPQLVNSHLWGSAYATGTEGATIAQIERYITVDRPLVIAWKSAGAVAEEFKFTTAYAPKVDGSTPRVHKVTLYTATTGAISDITGTATITATGITPASIATDDIVTAWEEF